MIAVAVNLHEEVGASGLRISNVIAQGLNGTRRWHSLLAAYEKLRQGKVKMNDGHESCLSRTILPGCLGHSAINDVKPRLDRHE